MNLECKTNLFKIKWGHGRLWSRSECMYLMVVLYDANVNLHLTFE